MTAAVRSAWASRRLGELVTLTSGQSPSGFKFSSSGTPYYKVDQLGRSTKYLTRRSTPYFSRNLPSVPAGSIVIAKRGGAIALNRVRLLTEPSFMDTNVMALTPSAELDPEFLYYWLAFRGLWDIADITSVPQINNKHILPLDIDLPSLTEQRRIASVLRDIDEMLSTLEQQVTKKQSIKQGMMQELLTGRTRIPGFQEGWADATIGSVARVIGGGTPSTRVPAYWNGGIPWFTPAEIRASGSGLVSCSQRTITSEGLANSGAALLPVGTVLVTSRASIGNCAIAEVPVTTNQGFASMVPKDSRSSWFLYYWTQQNTSELESRAAGSTFLEISASKVASIPLRRPALGEQQAIGDVLRDADLELDALAVRLAKARAIKTGMMQELLTGHTRLPGQETAA